MTIEEKIDKMYDELFSFIANQVDDVYDLVIEYKSEATGKTIRRSWQDREKRLSELEQK